MTNNLVELPDPIYDNDLDLKPELLEAYDEYAGMTDEEIHTIDDIIMHLVAQSDEKDEDYWGTLIEYVGKLERRVRGGCHGSGY